MRAVCEIANLHWMSKSQSAKSIQPTLEWSTEDNKKEKFRCRNEECEAYYVLPPALLGDEN